MRVCVCVCVCMYVCVHARVCDEYIANVTSGSFVYGQNFEEVNHLCFYVPQNDVQNN